MLSESTQQAIHTHIQKVANGIRRRVLEHTIKNNGGYLSQACSAAEILAVLYTKVMKLGPSIAPPIPPPFSGVPGADCAPAFLGSYVMNKESGISHYALFGQMMRIAGADATIYPNYGGRFSFSREDCIRIAKGTETPMGLLKTIFPAPGGGMSLDRVKEMREIYGYDIIFLIGGGLHSLGPDLPSNCRYFRKLVEEI